MVQTSPVTKEVIDVDTEPNDEQAEAMRQLAMAQKMVASKVLFLHGNAERFLQKPFQAGYREAIKKKLVLPSLLNEEQWNAVLDLLFKPYIECRAYARPPAPPVPAPTVDPPGGPSGPNAVLASGTLVEAGAGTGSPPAGAGHPACVLKAEPVEPNDEESRVGADPANPDLDDEPERSPSPDLLLWGEREEAGDSPAEAAPPPPDPRTVAALRRRSIGTLRRCLELANVSTHNCIEKSDLLHLVLEHGLEVGSESESEPEQPQPTSGSGIPGSAARAHSSSLPTPPPKRRKNSGDLLDGLAGAGRWRCSQCERTVLSVEDVEALRAVAPRTPADLLATAERGPATLQAVARLQALDLSGGVSWEAIWGSNIGSRLRLNAPHPPHPGDGSCAGLWLVKVSSHGQTSSDPPPAPVPLRTHFRPVPHAAHPPPPPPAPCPTPTPAATPIAPRAVPAPPPPSPPVPVNLRREAEPSHSPNQAPTADGAVGPDGAPVQRCRLLIQFEADVHELFVLPTTKLAVPLSIYRKRMDRTSVTFLAGDTQVDEERDIADHIPAGNTLVLRGLQPREMLQHLLGS